MYSQGLYRSGRLGSGAPHNVVAKLCLNFALVRRRIWPYPVPALDSLLSRNEAILTPALPQASDILAALGQAVFAWDIASDTMVWGEQVGAVFPAIPTERLATGAEFARLIEPTQSLRSAALAQT